MAGMSNTISLKFNQDFFKNYARDKDCQIRIAAMYGLQCNTEPGNVVLCHPSIAGLKAMGSRSSSVPDIGGAWGCDVCHGLVDGRIKLPYSVEGDQLMLWHLEGVIRTINELVKAGVLPNP